MRSDRAANHSKRPVVLGGADYLYALAYFHAKRQGVSSDHLEDCALEFVEAMLLRNAEALSHSLRETFPHAWLHQCAANFIRDFQRRSRRVYEREVTWPNRDEDNGEEALIGYSRDPPSPETCALQAEVRMRIERALEDLAPLSRKLFLRHYLYGESLSELAEQTQRSPDAVRMVLNRACAHLRSTLKRQGMEENDVEDYLAVLSAMRGGGHNRLLE